MTGLIYLAVIVVSLFGIRGLVHRFSLPVRREVLAPTVACTTVIFLTVDAIGIWRGWFGTPLTSTVLMLPGHGALGTGLPVEEIVLLAALSSLVCVLMSLASKQDRVSSAPLSPRVVISAVGAMGVTMALIAGAQVGGEYTAVSAGMGVGALVLTAPLLANQRSARRSLAIFLVLTVIFDNLMCAVGLFHYASEPRSGVAVGIAPIEDIFYAAAFALVAIQLTSSISRGGGTWWRIFLSSRPVSWINTALPFAGGALAAGAGESVGAWFLPLLLWWGVAYNAFLYGINDLYDLETDRHNPRKGGAEGALLQQRDLPALRTTLLLSALSALIFLLTEQILVPLFCLLAIGSATIYSAPWFVRARAIPILDSVISATHFVLPALAGLMLGGSIQAAWVAPLTAFLLWNMASHVVGALQDVDADRHSGIATVGTLFGVRGGGWFAASLYAVAGLLLLVQGEWLQRLGALLPVASVLSLLPLLLGPATHQAARAAWRRFMLLNLFLGAGAAILIIQSLVGSLGY